MRSFVAAQDRSDRLQEELGLGRGLRRINLLILLSQGPMTLRDIAETSGFDAPYATVVVDKLEVLGLVIRTSHPDDNRRKLVMLTEAGVRASSLADSILAEPPVALVALMDYELATLEEIMDRVHRSVAKPDTS